MALNPYFLQGSSTEQNLVQSLINEQIKKPLAKKILFGTDVDLVKLKVKDNGINIRTDKIQT